MGIMLLGHPRVSVAQLARDNGQWRAAHDQPASIGMTQNVKTDRRSNAGSVACIPHESNLVAATPGSPILSDKNQNWSCACLPRQPQKAFALRPSRKYAAIFRIS